MSGAIWISLGTDMLMIRKNWKAVLYLFGDLLVSIISYIILCIRVDIPKLLVFRTPNILFFDLCALCGSIRLSLL
jgi:hypothetical protein